MLPIAISVPPPLPVSGLGTVTVIPTFEGASVYWRPDSAGSRGHSTFRVQGSGDAYRTSLDFFEDSGEYRGSLFYLAADTTYELRLHVDGSVIGTVAFTTWEAHDPLFNAAHTFTISETREVVCVTGATGTWSDGDSISSPSMSGGTLKGAGAITGGVGHLVHTVGSGSIADGETITNATSGATATASAAGLMTEFIDLDNVQGTLTAWIKYKPSAAGVKLDAVDIKFNFRLRDTQFVMIRGFDLENGEEGCIQLDNSGGAPTSVETSDIVIEENNMTNWGRVALHILKSSLNGTPQVGDVITGRTSGATGKVTDYIVSDTPLTDLLLYAKDDASNTRFDIAEIIDGSVSSFDAEVATMTGYALDLDNGINSANGQGINFKRIIVQRNDIHDPRGDANSWAEDRRDVCGDVPDVPSNCHPEGAVPISLTNSGGNNVLRFNTVRGSGAEIDDDFTGHWFKDGISGKFNDDDAGYPGADSDVYGNDVRQVWDNCLEPEGGGKNIRFFENWASEGLALMAISPVRLGPIYIFRNVFHHFRRSFGEGFANDGRWVKNEATAGVNGDTHIYCNTLWSPDNGGAKRGVVPKGSMFNFFGRNNIIKVTDKAWGGGGGSANNDVDYELTDGTFVNVTKGPNVVDGVATYCDLLDVSNVSGTYQIGETLNFSPSSATAKVAGLDIGKGEIHIDTVTGTIAVNDVATGADSAATSDVDTITATGSIMLTATSLGVGTGEARANVTDKWDVANHDIGAQQRGQSLLNFGHLAYL